MNLYSYSIHYTVIELILWLYTISVISFAWDKNIWFAWFYLVNFQPAFTCARAIGNLWSICLGVKVINHFPCFSFIGNIPLLKALRINSWPP